MIRIELRDEDEEMLRELSHAARLTPTSFIRQHLVSAMKEHKLFQKRIRGAQGYVRLSAEEKKERADRSFAEAEERRRKAKLKKENDAIIEWNIQSFMVTENMTREEATAYNEEMMALVKRQAANAKYDKEMARLRKLEEDRLEEERIKKCIEDNKKEAAEFEAMEIPSMDKIRAQRLAEVQEAVTRLQGDDGE